MGAPVAQAERPSLPPHVRAWLFSDRSDEGVRERASSVVAALAARGAALPPLCDQIARARDARGLTQEQLGAATGTGQPAIARLESGLTVAPTTRTLTRLARALETVFFIGPGAVDEEEPVKPARKTKGRRATR